MSAGKGRINTPAVDIARLREMISAMGDDEMLTVEIVTDSQNPAPGEDSGHGE